MKINKTIFIEPLRKYIKKKISSEYNEQQMLLFGFAMDDFINPLINRIMSIPIEIIDYTNDPKQNPSGSFSHQDFKIYIENVNESKYFKDQYRAGYANYVNGVIFHEMVHAVDYIKKLYDSVSYNALEMGKKYYHDPEEIRAYRAMMKDFLEDELKIPAWRVRKMMAKYTTDLDAGRSQWLQEIQESKVAKNTNWYKKAQEIFSGTYYHGSNEEGLKALLESTKNTVRGKGIFLSNSIKYAKTFGRFVYVCSVLLEKPKIYESSLDLEIDSMKYDGYDNLYFNLKKQNRDGVVILKSKVSTGVIEEIICFKPQNVKIESVLK